MKNVHNREKGTGTIEKKRNRFYLKMRIGGKTKTTLLLGQDDKPVTTRKDAEKAAALLRPVLRARQKEEIALHVASARRMRKESCLTIDHVWQTYLAQSQRPDSSPGTLHSYQKSWNGFLAWLSRKHPELRNVSQLHEEIAVEYFNDIWNGNLSARTYNAYRQALKLIFKHIMPVAGLENNPFNKIIRKTGHSESRNEFTSDQVQAIFDGFQKGFYYTSEQEGLGPGRKRVRKLVTQEYHPLHKEEMSVLLNLCCWTGCRGQDGCLMKWENVDMEHGFIHYIPRKTARQTNSREVSLPLHTALYDALVQAETFRSRNQAGEDFILPSVAARFQRNPGGVQEDVRKIIHCATGCAASASKRV